MRLDVLNVITPVSRPFGNLVRLAESLEQLRELFELRWYCVFDPVYYKELPSNISCHFKALAPLGKTWGNISRNVAINEIKEGWCYFMDDDNLLHDDFPRALRRALLANPEARAFMFDQVLKNQKIRFVDGHPLEASAKSMRIGSLDTSQLVIHRDLIGDIRWPSSAVYVGDYVFFTTIFQAAPDAFVFVNDGVCYWNRQVDSVHFMLH